MIACCWHSTFCMTKYITWTDYRRAWIEEMILLAPCHQLIHFLYIT